MSAAAADPRIGCVDLMVDRHVRAGLGACTALLEVKLDGEHATPRRRALSYRDLQAQTMAFAQQWAGAHTTTAEPLRIALVGSATLETVVAWLGAMRAGHQVFLVHPDLPAAQYDALLQAYRPDHVWRDRTVRLPLGSLLPDIPVHDAPGEAATTDAPTTTATTEVADPLFLDDRRPALVLASSGSTGTPKLCVHSHRAFWAFERNVSRSMWRLSATDRVLASGGPYFSFGLQGIHPPLSVGATAVLLPRWGAHADFLRVMGDESVTVFLAVPTLYHLLQSRATPQQLAQATASLRVGLSAGERLPSVVRRRWQTHTGVPLCDSIGTTETFAPYLSEDVGLGEGLRAIPGFDYEMRLAGSVGANGQSVFAAHVSGVCMMLGTLDAHGQIEPTPRSFATHDLFVLEDKGWHFVSRRSERVKVSGQWVSPQELEEHLLQDPRVLKAAAMVIDTPEGLQRLRAFVVLLPSDLPDAEVAQQLLHEAKALLRPKALCPDRICPVAELIATPTGKLQRAELKGQMDALHLASAELAEHGVAA